MFRAELEYRQPTLAQRVSWATKATNTQERIDNPPDAEGGPSSAWIIASRTGSLPTAG